MLDLVDNGQLFVLLWYRRYLREVYAPAVCLANYAIQVKAIRPVLIHFLYPEYEPVSKSYYESPQWLLFLRISRHWSISKFCLSKYMFFSENVIVETYVDKSKEHYKLTVALTILMKVKVICIFFSL